MKSNSGTLVAVAIVAAIIGGVAGAGVTTFLGDDANAKPGSALAPADTYSQGEIDDALAKLEARLDGRVSAIQDARRTPTLPPGVGSAPEDVAGLQKSVTDLGARVEALEKRPGPVAGADGGGNNNGGGDPMQQFGDMMRGFMRNGGGGDGQGNPLQRFFGGGGGGFDGIMGRIGADDTQKQTIQAALKKRDDARRAAQQAYRKAMGQLIQRQRDGEITEDEFKAESDRLRRDRDTTREAASTEYENTVQSTLNAEQYDKLKGEREKMRSGWGGRRRRGSDGGGQPGHGDSSGGR